MICPQCMYEGNLINGRCARCGFNALSNTSGSLRVDPARAAPLSRPLEYAPMRGDTLREGRYRLMKPMELPETQRKQGAAWTALDSRNSNRQVVVREIRVPPEIARTTPADRVAYTIGQRLTELGKHPGFPKVADFFRENDTYYIVFLYPEGESLAVLLKRQGGALPESMVAEYGYQLCGLLALLAEQQPPIVHGSINPETIIISEGQQFVSLIHIPLFKPDALPGSAEKVASGYYAPEQVHGESSSSSDLYSLAVTMHHAVTGYDPHARLALFHPPARRLNPATTMQMEMILVRQLSLSQSQRYSSPLEMQKDLAALIEAYPDSTENKPGVQTVDPLSLSSAQLRERVHGAVLLNMGVFAAICVLILIGIFFAVLRP